MTVITRLPKVRAQRLGNTHGGRGLAFTQWSGGDGGHVNVLAVLAFGKAVQDLKFDLRLVRTIEFKFAFLDAQFLRDPNDRLEFASLRDINIGWHRTGHPSVWWGHRGIFWRQVS